MAKKAGKNAGKLKVKGRKYSYGCQIIKLEKRCFDWVCAGKTVTDVDDGYEITDTQIKPKHHIIKTVYFKRPYDYQQNFLFRFTELLSNVVSRLRVIALNLLIPAIIVGVLLAIFNDEDSEFVGMMCGIYFGVYGGLIGLSLILAGLGVLWRKVFKLTEKTDEIQEQNGFQKWSEYTRMTNLRITTTDND